MRYPLIGLKGLIAIKSKNGVSTKETKWWIETYIRLIREVDWTFLWVYSLIGLRGLIGIKSENSVSTKENVQVMNRNIY